MAYVVVSKFADLEDNKRLYEAGDVFPCKGRTVSRERLAELASNKNKTGKPLIKKVDEENDDDGVVSDSSELVRPRPKKVVRRSNYKQRRDKSSPES